MRNWIISFCILLSLPLKAQHHSICDSAASVSTSVYGPVYADGKPNSFLTKSHSNGMYFEKPQTVVWLTFVIPYDTVLTFDLVPSNHSDDLDFLLFKDEHGNFCRKFTSAIRGNIANSSQTTEGKTGLATFAQHNFEPLGKHSSYSNALEVKKGERYYLAVDNYTSPKGAFTFFLHLHFTETPPPPKIPENTPHLRPLLTTPTLNIIVMDSFGKPVRAKIKIAGLNGKIIKTLANVSSYSLLWQPKEYIRITCLSPGYLMNQSTFKGTDSAKVLFDTIRLAKIEEHQSMVLKDIEFEPDQDAFLPAAKEPLSSLLEFMLSNPKVNILIKGYVNDPANTNSTRYDQDLSEARAKAVLKYLSDNGIAANRMAWKGFGNKEMLYPNPQTWEESRSNRRVEIEVK